MNRSLFLFAALVCASTANATSLQTILELNASAHGQDSVANVQSVEVDLHITEPTFEVTGHYLASRDGFMRIDIYAGEDRVFAEGLTAKCAWEWNPGQPEEELGACVGEAETGALRHGIEMPGNFYTLLDVHERGDKVELVGETKEEWQVRVTLSDGFSRDYFIDRETHRLTRARDNRAFHPGIDPTKVNIETRYEEPRFVEGVLRFKRQVNVNVDTGEVLGTTKIVGVTHNPEVKDGMFEAGWVPASP